MVENNVTIIGFILQLSGLFGLVIWAVLFIIAKLTKTDQMSLRLLNIACLLVLASGSLCHAYNHFFEQDSTKVVRTVNKVFLSECIYRLGNNPTHVDIRNCLEYATERKIVKESR